MNGSAPASFFKKKLAMLGLWHRLYKIFALLSSFHEVVALVS
jgi:hypothetical protein